MSDQVKIQTLEEKLNVHRAFRHTGDMQLTGVCKLGYDGKMHLILESDKTANLSIDFDLVMDGNDAHMNAICEKFEASPALIDKPGELRDQGEFYGAKKDE